MYTFIPSLSRPRTLRPVAVCLGLALVPLTARADLAGVINDYAVVTEADDDTLTVGDASAFQAGDLVVVIQMAGAEVDRTDSEAHGDLLSVGEVGRYEIATVASVSGTDLTLTASLKHTYDVDAAVQLVRVATGHDETTTGTLTAAPWDGATGGVFAYIGTGSLTLDHDLDVSGVGYRAGRKNPTIPWVGCRNEWATPFTIPFADTMSKPGHYQGQKGEGITLWDDEHWGAKGKNATGGGGGTYVHGGGGGGGNGGVGGRGGADWCGQDTYGRGGLSLEPDPDAPRLLLGGGGGGGAGANGGYPSAGGAGGGIVILLTERLTGTGRIVANGAPGGRASSDGAGAGGAGGTLLLDIGTTGDCAPLEQALLAEGGAGGNDTGTSDGGGGGGGVFWSTSEEPHPGTSVAGGRAPSAPATDGTEGVVVLDARVSFTDLADHQVGCKGDDDPDKDGLTTVEERELGTDPLDADSDDDGLSDGDEVLDHTTDPLDADSDDDGLSDGDEVLDHTTDPLDADSDDDGLSDGDEVLTHTTDPLDADSDDDGLSDGDEVLTHTTDPLDADSDDDGLSDGDEVLLHHTDPLDADTDDGGVDDGEEVDRGTDPLLGDDDIDVVVLQGNGCSCSSTPSPLHGLLLPVSLFLVAVGRRRPRRR